RPRQVKRLIGMQPAVTLTRARANLDQLLSRQQENGILRWWFAVRLRCSCAEGSRQVEYQRIGSVRGTAAQCACRGIDNRHRSAVTNTGVSATAVYRGGR